MIGSAEVKLISDDDVPEMPPFTGKLARASQLPASYLSGKAQSLLQEMWHEVLEKGGSPSFVIISNSMSPLIKVDDVVRIKRVAPLSIRIGDIVAFQSGQYVIVHRIIGKRWLNGHLYFRQIGDDCRYSGRFPAQKLIGKVMTIQKKEHEIHLDSPRQMIKNKLIGWRLRLYDALARRARQRNRSNFWRLFRLTWRLYRSASSVIAGGKS